MLKNVGKTTNISGTSIIESNIVVHMNASISASGAVNINQSVIDMQTYSANAAECDADFEEFKKMVMEEAAK